MDTKNELERLHKENERLVGIINKVRDERVVLMAELRQYRTAVSAVTWLLAQGQKQPEFQT